ncbi:amidase [Falsiroseomonas oryziterrae]|uniref:amidase n=1 Tax=Falsiroseomonas oryziterrae TaxID=2911368 RepID=UPI001F3F8738|nr:amidase [Roseomonas sp. NPKOSM-4]
MAAGQLHPAAVLEACLARVAALDGALHAVHHLDAEGARARAAAHPAGALAGIPWGIKDNFDVAGLPCTANSRLRAGRVATADAPLVAAARAAGAVLIGKLATWEYGTGTGAEHFDLPFPPARNPWDRARFTGGSSTGAGVAVATGMALFAIGSDTTGSVRLPAAATGCVGLLLAPGRLPMEGALPNTFSMDRPGPITWTVEDAAIVADALCGTRLRDACGQDARGLRVGVLRDPGPGLPAADAELATALEEGLGVLSGLGARITEVRLPWPTSNCLDAARLIGAAESASIHEAELRDRAAVMGTALRDKLLAGIGVRAVDYLAAQRFRRAFTEALEPLWAEHDVLLGFGPLHLPPRLGVEPESTAFTMETMLTPASLAGLPALVQCNGFSAGGLPLAWQAMVPPGREAAMIGLADAYERATPWRARRPA